MELQKSYEGKLGNVWTCCLIGLNDVEIVKLSCRASELFGIRGLVS